jgi:hypothetical protein
VPDEDIKELPKDELEEINELLSTDAVQKLLKMGFKLTREFDTLSKLIGIEMGKSKLSLIDKNNVMIYGKLKLDKSKVISSYPVQYVKIAADLKFDVIHVCQKDYPCIITRDEADKDGFVEAIIIAPRVSDD